MFMARKHKRSYLTSISLTFSIFLIFCGFTRRHFISDGSDPVSSDGVHSQQEPFLPFIRRSSPAKETCEQTYGFMPCSSKAVGNLFLIVVYGYFTHLAATFLSTGTEILLEILGPGFTGGFLLSMLGPLADAMLILVCGLCGSTETAQRQVSVGMGLLAGSSVLLLTVIWGSCVIVGKCDIKKNIAKDLQDTKGFSLTGSGVSTDIWTCYSAIIMAVSVIPFMVVQIPQILHSNSGRHLAVLIALIVSVSLLLSYCVYQVFQPWIQSRRLAYAKHKHVIAGILQRLRMHALGRLCKDDGTVDEEVLKKLFNTVDENCDGYLSHSEIRALVMGISFDEINLDENDAIEGVMRDFDNSQDSHVSFPEFFYGIERWLNEAKGSTGSSQAGPGTMKHLTDFHEQTKREYYFLGEVQSDEIFEEVDNPRWNSFKAVLLLLLGTVIAAVFADPLVDAVENFSSATSIPSFFVSFIALPLATNSGEAVSAITYASRKKLRSASLTFSELYGEVTRKIMLCLSVFLALVYVRGLTWDFSSEVLIILIVCIVMGVLGSVRTTFPLWSALIAFLLYPFSLALVYVLDYVFDWS